MDKDTRGYIERATQKARRLLENEFAAQLEGDFDIHRNGSVAEQAGVHLTPRQVFQRARIIAAIDHKRAAGMAQALQISLPMRPACWEKGGAKLHWPVPGHFGPGSPHWRCG